MISKDTLVGVKGTTVEQLDRYFWTGRPDRMGQLSQRWQVTLATLHVRVKL